MRNPFAAFRKVLAGESASETRLGCPSADDGARLRRMNAMSIMTGGRGFTVPKAQPRVDSQGRTRGQRRRATYARLFLEN